MWVFEVVAKLKDKKVEFAVAGGYAVALHGAIRGTIDLDLVVTIDEKNLMRTESALHELGLSSRLPVTAKDIFQFRKEYIEKRNIIAWSFIDSKNPSHVVDIIITHNLKSIQKIQITTGGIKIPVVAISSLIAMKKLAGRPQDLEDIKALRQLNEED
jgi:predicted nucleotidyltransferase